MIRVPSRVSLRVPLLFWGFTAVGFRGLGAQGFRSLGVSGFRFRGLGI